MSSFVYFEINEGMVVFRFHSFAISLGAIFQRGRFGNENKWEARVFFLGKIGARAWPEKPPGSSTPRQGLVFHGGAGFSIPSPWKRARRPATAPKRVFFSAFFSAMFLFNFSTATGTEDEDRGRVFLNLRKFRVRWERGTIRFNLLFTPQPHFRDAFSRLSRTQMPRF